MTEETDKIVCFEERPHLFNQPDTDFKAEVVASGLKEGGYDAERTLISRRGDMRRGFSKDIQEIRSEYSHYDLTDYLYLHVNRRSIYDALPEGISRYDEIRCWVTGSISSMFMRYCIR